jgi:Na+/proline symporter/signal transduction histidine kinase
MGFELAAFASVGVAYLVLLFLIAHAADRGKIPERWVNNPWVYTLSLGVYATSWSYYGSVGFAAEHGFDFLTVYLGVTLAFVLSPVLLKPILQLTREYQLSSLADVFAFRFRSQFAGMLVTLFMLLGTLPYIALQIRAVTESMRMLTDQAPSGLISIGFCLVLTLFTILFGARHLTVREQHRGLVLAIAFESLVKLIAISSIGIAALFGVFGGVGGLNDWLREHPQATQALYQPVREGPWSTLLFLAFAAAFLLPRQFHMLFTESFDSRYLNTAAWAFPLYLLLLNLAIPVILWGGQALALDMPADYYGLGISITTGPGWLPMLAYIGGVSAASAMVIVTTLALSSMSLNNLLLPANYPEPEMDLYRWLLLGRRILIAVIILASYGFYTLLEDNQGLVQLGLISFVAVAQFAPGIVGLLYWRRATRDGFIWGLSGGIVVWFATLILPVLQSSGIIRMNVDMLELQLMSGLDRWEFATFFSLSINSALFVIVTLLTRQSELEREAAHACCSDSFVPLAGGVLALRSPQQFRERLAMTLGHDTANREVDQALSDLAMSTYEARASELRRLRERIERNLSGLIGPQMAHMIIDHRLRLDSEAQLALADSMRYAEEQLEASRSQLRGLTAELDDLRRLHRQILRDLPLGVCATDASGSVVMWNYAMEALSDIKDHSVLGVRLQRLPEPWGGLLAGFARAGDDHMYRMEIAQGGQSRWLNLHKSAYADPGFVRNTLGQPGLVMLVEDLTDLENLETELAHSDRLASIGRLAAGVAHEIGNPVTGIASLAQNLRYETDPTILRESIEQIIQQTKRISGILQTLTGFSRGGIHIPKRETFHLDEALEESIRLVQLTQAGRQIQFATHCAKQISLTGNRQQLTQVFVNLLTNAGDASRQGERIDVTASVEAGEAVIEFQDRGEGIPQVLQQTVFEPFYTTKPTGQGTGLGLSLAHRIVAEHAGVIRIDSQPGTGTRVVVRLPLQSVA